MDAVDTFIISLLIPPIAVTDLVSVWSRNAWTDYAELASYALLFWWPTTTWVVLNSGNVPAGKISPGRSQWELMSRSDFTTVILSEVKLQRSPENFSGRDQAFNLGSILKRRSK